MATRQPDPESGWGAHEPQRVNEVESFGIEIIPPADRTGTPFDLFRLTLGGANTFATVVLGAFPVLVFGLGFWEAMLAVLVGVVIGGTILMPMALFGPLNGTNNAVSSGAHFGVVGRIVGSFLALLVAITFFAISIFTSGDILVGALDELFGTGRPDWLVAFAYALFAVLIVVICLYGFRFMLAVNKLAVVTATALYILGAIAYGPDLDLGYAGVAEGDAFVAAFVGSTLLVMANPLSFGAFLGDWSRYIPPTASRGRLMSAVWLAQFATIIPFGFGVATATVIALEAPAFAEVADYAGGLVDVTPGWFLIPVCIIAVIGGLSTGTTSLYGTGLDFSSVFPRLSRVQSTAFISVIAVAVVFLGGIAQRALDDTVTRMHDRTSIALTRSMAYHPGVQHRVAEMRMAMDTIDWSVDRVAADWAAGAAHEDWPIRIVSMKYTATNNAFKVVDTALDLTGGSGIFKRSRLEQMFRDCRLGRIHPANDLLAHELIGKLQLGINPDEAPRWG